MKTAAGPRRAWRIAVLVLGAAVLGVVCDAWRKAPVLAPRQPVPLRRVPGAPP